MGWIKCQNAQSRQSKEVEVEAPSGGEAGHQVPTPAAKTAAVAMTATAALVPDHANHRALVPGIGET